MTDTRDKLLSAAEQLFAERGVDAVSLREITRAAGARNVIAVQYHFEDRAGVLTAILAKHLPDVDARRHALLDGIEAEIDAGAGPTARAIA
ncbi:MAG: helix-turn-helix transcriptional regulator, partial [Pseudonocardiales bacterium]|nr:helix-turn-helix transcriptional regulator [Pseudonocardiales bacterium]